MFITLFTKSLERILPDYLREESLGDLSEGYYRLQEQGKSRIVCHLITLYRGLHLVVSSYQSRADETSRANSLLGTSDEQDLQIKESISLTQERLRQARYKCNFAITITTVSTMLSLTGVGLCWSGNKSEGTFTAASGIISSLGSFKVVKDANNRIARANSGLNKIADNIRHI